MMSTDRLIGRLTEQASAQDRRIRKLEERVETLQRFRWTFLGACILLSFGFTLFVTLAEIALHRH